MSSPLRVAIYSRVSTPAQSTENQRFELERVSSARGWSVSRHYSDQGVSGIKGRGDRPGLDALLKAATRREIDLVAVWSLDRLGRSLQNLVETVNELQRSASTSTSISRHWTQARRLESLPSRSLVRWLSTSAN
jgi:DNA invertase Pin-like site-specific DNA recombinase